MESEREDDHHGPSGPPSREATEPPKTTEPSESRSSVTVSALSEPKISSEDDTEPEVEREAKTPPEAGKRKHASTPDDQEHEPANAKEIVQARHNTNNSTRASSIASTAPPPRFPAALALNTRAGSFGSTLPPAALLRAQALNTRGSSITSQAFMAPPPPLPATGALQYKPRSQVVFQKNGEGPEMVVSRQDVNQVNFYAAHPMNTGDRFIAVIEPTDEGLNALIQTIREEIGAPDVQKRVVVSFATVKTNDVPRPSVEIPNVRHAQPPFIFTHQQVPLQPFAHPTGDTAQSMARPDQRVSSLSQSVSSFGPSNRPRQRRAPIATTSSAQLRQSLLGSRVRPQAGTFRAQRRNQASTNGPAFSNVPSRLAGPSASRAASTTSSVELVRTGPALAPAPSVNHSVDGRSDDVVITHVEPRMRPFATPQPTGPTLRPTSLLSPGSDALTPGSSDRFILARLQLQWPYPNQLGGRLSAIGSFVIIYRNILRHLHDPNAGTLDENVYSLRTLFKDGERRLWNYLWLQMDTPDSQSKLALREETKALVDDIAWLLNIHEREEFTFERLTAGLLRALWTTNRLRFYQPNYMYQYPIIGNSWSGWERLPLEQEILNRHARIEWDGTGRITDKFRELFDVRSETDGSTPSKIKYCCAMPAVIEVHLTAAPAGVPPGRRILEALGDFYLWDWDTTARVSDDDFAAGDATPKVEGMYQLMGVVRLRKPGNPDERDLPRIYTWGKKCVVPETETCFFPAAWTLAEPGRQFRLYYVKIEDKSIGSGWVEEYPGQYQG